MNLSVQGRIFLVALNTRVLISPSLAGDLYSMYLQWRYVLGWNEGSEYVDGRGQKKNASGLVLNLFLRLRNVSTKKLRMNFFFFSFLLKEVPEGKFWGVPLCT